MAPSVFKMLNPFAFIMAFGAGLLVVYMTQPKPKVVIRFPTPLNAGKIIYREDGECYKYKVEEVKCDEYDKSAVIEQPSVPKAVNYAAIGK